jgi:signal transduction histidine kinase
MRKYYIISFALMILVYVNPFLPLSVKGICGFFFILTSCVKTNLRGSLVTAAACELLATVNLIFGVGVDVRYRIASMILGTIMYALTAVLLGRFTETLKTRNTELKHEIEMRKQAEDELLEKLNEITEDKRIIDIMLENDKMKTEFFSNISHELRTPLNAILGSVQLMELYLPQKQYACSRENITKKTFIIKQNCYRLIKIVNNLIDITKINSSDFQIHRKKCDVVNIIKEIALSVSDYVEGAELHIGFCTDIEHKIMACDDEKIERVLLNLLSNAVKFTPSGGQITVGVHRKEDGLAITVEDNGIGIPKDKYDMVFQQFGQVDSTFTRHHEGSGIGLSLSKSLVEMHGGSISFESSYGEGTCFTVYLPDLDIPGEVLNKSSVVKHSPIERIQVEFSDIYFSKCEHVDQDHLGIESR